MNLAEPDRQPSYLPLYQEFAVRVDEEMPAPPWSDAVGWSTALRRTADLVEPDAIAVRGTEPLYQGLRTVDGASPDAPRFEAALGPAVESLLETVRILDDVRAEPVVCLVPGPTTLCAERFDEGWLRGGGVDDLVALEALHEASQLLTDVVRDLGGAAAGLVVDEPAVETALEGGLTVEDVLLETGALFNVADHHGLSVFGRVPESVHDAVPALADGYDAVLLAELSPATLEALADVDARIGGGFNADLWEATDAEFETAARSYLEALPEGFVLAPELPGSVSPERVRRLRELLEEART